MRYNMICDWTCPKSKSQRPKILKNDHFPLVWALLHADLDHKGKSKKLGKQLYVAYLSFHEILIYVTP